MSYLLGMVIQSNMSGFFLVAGLPSPGDMQLGLLTPHRIRISERGLKWIDTEIKEQFPPNTHPELSDRFPYDVSISKATSRLSDILSEYGIWLVDIAGLGQVSRVDGPRNDWKSSDDASYRLVYAPFRTDEILAISAGISNFISEQFGHIADELDALGEWVMDHKNADVSRITDYYVPLVIKLGKIWATLEHVEERTKEEEDTLAEIQASVPKIADGIHVFLVSLRRKEAQTQNLDIASDIKVLDAMLAKDGLTDGI